MKNTQNTPEKIEAIQMIESLKIALKKKLISVNDYCTMYYTYSQKLK
jgi:hypothetical protein